MSWYPIANLPPQLENASGVPYSGAVLKAYAAGTSTNIPMATDYTGVTTAATMLLNSSGYPTYLGTIVIPHLQQNYKLALYPDQASADANSGAIWTVDNVQIADATNTSFIQYFDGDGVTSTFTLSTNFGTDENILMVFADRAIPNYVTNGDFASDTIWAKGAGWTIGAGVATAAGAISTAITQNANVPLVQGQSYTVEFTVTASAGTLTPSVGGNAGTTRGAGTWRETIIAGSTQVLAFTGAAFTGTLDNASVKPTYAAQRIINRPDEYTLVGNQLTLNNVPPSGTKNIIVFAPSQLLGAANNAAAAAATSEANALTYYNGAVAAKNAADADVVATGAIYDAFDDRYLGAKSADPTLDNDGNALLTGALYWNTVSSVMKVYSGTVWGAAYVGAGGFLVAANNLNDVSSVATARANLGLGASATLNQAFTTEGTIASASTTDLGSVASNIISVTGTATITALGSSASTANPLYFLRFTGAATLTHNATSLILPGAASITTAAGDTAVAKYEGSGNWRVVSYTKANGQAVSGSGGMVLLATTNASGASSVAFSSTYITSTYNKYVIEFDGVYGSVQTSLLFTVSADNGSSYLSSNYKWTGFVQMPSSGTVSTYNNNAASNIDLSGAGGDTIIATSTVSAAGTLKFANPSASKTFSLIWDIVSGNYQHNRGIGVNTGTTAINNIKIAPGSGTFTGNFHLYGIQGT